MSVRRLAVCVLLVLAACGGDDGESADPGCEMWSDLLRQQDQADVSDEDAAATLRDIEAAAEDDEVQQAATALAARLEDGADISAAYARMGEVCGL